MGKVSVGKKPRSYLNEGVTWGRPGVASRYGDTRNTQFIVCLVPRCTKFSYHG